MAKKKSTPKKRQSIRFTPDPLLVAYLGHKNDFDFKPHLVGLILNESFTGCSILLNNDDTFKKGQDLLVKVGKLPVMSAKVVWVKNLEESIFKIGLRFLE